MEESDEREGEPIYRDGKIEIRTFPRDTEAHNVWIGKYYRLFQGGCLKQYATLTPAEDLRMAFGIYDPTIPYILKIEGVSPEKFALALARARVKELETQLSEAYGNIHNLTCRE